MKKLYLLLLSFICFCSLSAFAQSNTCCEKQIKPSTSCEKPCPTKCSDSCKSNCIHSFKNQCFLCTKNDMNSLFRCMNLSEAQICNAGKIQDKYEQEVLSLEERIQCENQKLCQLERNCAKKGDIRKQKRLIKKLEKKKREICKCYEQQFKATLSSQQIRAYNKNKKK